MNVYLDNAATTALDPKVAGAIKSFMDQEYANPSSQHAYGRKARAAIEIARRDIASLLNCTPGEIVFTSGGTEANNAIIRGAIATYPIRHVISSAIEHHAVGHVLKKLEERKDIQLHYVRLDDKGNIDYDHLEDLLKSYPNAMVSLMHANNEIGNLLNIEQVAEMCHRYGSYFHSDTIQSVGHYRYDLQQLNIHGLAASAHKLHGPQGVGFMYINKHKKIEPYLYGGGQERGMRAGTENILGIVGLAKAMEVAYGNLEKDKKYIEGIKKYMIKSLREQIPEVIFNGRSGDVKASLYTVLSVGLPDQQGDKMLLFSLDLEGIAASGGGACSSSEGRSHVIATLSPRSSHEVIRFSFSKYTQYDEIDYAVKKLATIFKQYTMQEQNIC